jgi:SAM-dependent methyltransferase
MEFESQPNLVGEGLHPGSSDYRAFVGPAKKYDLLGAMQFNLLTTLGLREHHYLLDIGCGSLRSGRLFIPYLLQNRYFGIEPEEWLIEEGIKKEVGNDLITLKNPRFSYDKEFNLSVFNQEFDFIIAHSIFSHASQSQLKKCMSEAKKVMNSNSIFVATFIEGEENYTDDDWAYPDWVTYRMDYMIELAKEQELVCKPIDFWHPSRQTWIAIVNPKNEDSIPYMISNARASLMERELKICKEKLSRLENLHSST